MKGYGLGVRGVDSGGTLSVMPHGKQRAGGISVRVVWGVQDQRLQGYLAHQKRPPPKTLQ